MCVIHSMIFYILYAACSIIYPVNAGQQSIYCPQKSSYIQIGMTSDQVIAACGMPLSKQDSNVPAMQQIPVQQLMFNSVGTQTAPSGFWTAPVNGQGGQSAFYGVWNVPVGEASGVQLEIDIADNKVVLMKINGATSNSLSICSNANITYGDPVSKVYNACGNPDTINNTYMNRMIPSKEKPQIWTYQAGQYQPTMTLMFVDGKLQSIN